MSQSSDTSEMEERLDHAISISNNGFEEAVEALNDARTSLHNVFLVQQTVNTSLARRQGALESELRALRAQVQDVRNPFASPPPQAQQEQQAQMQQPLRIYELPATPILQPPRLRTPTPRPSLNGSESDDSNEIFSGPYQSVGPSDTSNSASSGVSFRDRAMRRREAMNQLNRYNRSQELTLPSVVPQQIARIRATESPTLLEVRPPPGLFDLPTPPAPRRLRRRPARSRFMEPPESPPAFETPTPAPRSRVSTGPARDVPALEAARRNLTVPLVTEGGGSPRSPQATGAHPAESQPETEDWDIDTLVSWEPTISPLWQDFIPPGALSDPVESENDEISQDPPPNTRASSYDEGQDGGHQYQH
ncbi:hypothetical protein PVAG01_08072 [Phlyctema vagabunda]|uniref:Uncharacterized protein n=1 Tax=Phlyctema vagabunda TaxID=108571 RepID=A0ABR4P8C9_9HELO